MLMLRLAVAILCDWALASLPIVFLWNVQMSIKLKAGICVLMGMGFLLVFFLHIISPEQYSTFSRHLLIIHSSGICAVVRTVLLKNLAATDVTCEYPTPASSLTRLIVTLSGNLVPLVIWAM